jgi:hypothetical protein
MKTVENANIGIMETPTVTYYLERNMIDTLKVIGFLCERAHEHRKY